METDLFRAEPRIPPGLLTRFGKEEKDLETSVKSAPV